MTTHKLSLADNATTEIDAMPGALALDPARRCLSKTAPLRDNRWRRGANATLQVARNQGWRGRADRYGASSIGRDWDGRSDIRFATVTMPAKTVADIVEELRQGIAARGVPLATLPTQKSVRVCDRSVPGWGALVIDVDFDEFISPVSVDDHCLAKNPDMTAAEIGATMADLVSKIHAVRNRTAAHELLLRRAFEEQSKLAGVVPLWLRISPTSFGWPFSMPQIEAREMVILKLDEDLRPIMDNDFASTATDIQRYLQPLGKIQARRAANLARLEAARSAGLISEVALALVEARGMDPGEVFSSLRAARLKGDRKGIVHQNGTTRETLTLVDGVVDANFKFKGGNYAPGKLTLDGDFPETPVISAKGRPLAAYVDHPAFKGAGITIWYARILLGKLRLYHHVRSITIEEATQARFTNAPDPIDTFGDGFGGAPHIKGAA